MKRTTLHEEMTDILKEKPNNQATLRYIASEVNRRNIYHKRDFSEVKPGQIRLRCIRYPHLFELIDKDSVKLKRKKFK